MENKYLIPHGYDIEKLRKSGELELFLVHGPTPTPEKKPFHLNGDRATYCDIDDTLVFTRHSLINLGLSQDDLENMTLVQIPAPYDGTLLPRYVNHRNVELLKECKLSGAATVCWSQAGHRWSASVVEVLGLNGYVDVTASKPTFLIDDLKAEDFMPKSAWKHPK